MNATYQTQELETARRQAAMARERYLYATSRRAKLEAAEELEFWTNRAAFLASACG